MCAVNTATFLPARNTDSAKDTVLSTFAIAMSFLILEVLSKAGLSLFLTPLIILSISPGVKLIFFVTTSISGIFSLTSLLLLLIYIP